MPKTVPYLFVFSLIEPEYAEVLEMQGNLAYGAPKRQYPTGNSQQVVCLHT